MARQARILGAIAILLSLSTRAPAQRGGETALAAALPVASVHFEQNATDGDVEVVFAIKGRSVGLVKLTVVAPDGRTVVDFTAPDGSTLGMRQFRFESPEPTDVDSLKAAYPEGQYTFTAATAAGQSLHGRSTLTHELPDTTAFVHPQAGAEGVDARELDIVWTATSDAVAYVIELEQLEQRGSDVNLTARLPKSATRLAVPRGFLRPGAKYQLGIGTVSAAGNMSFVETTFTTAKGQ